MKTIYFLLTRSDTYISRLIRLSTTDKYTHVSIAFEQDLRTLYSFARKHERFPLPAGLIQENIHSGFLAKYNSIPCAVYSLQVEDDVYYHAKSIAEGMFLQQEEYRYNLLGLILCKMNIPYKRKYYYFCSQFVSEILLHSNAVSLPKPPSLMRPADYMNLPGVSCEFQGRLHGLQSEQAFSF